MCTFLTFSTDGNAPPEYIEAALHSAGPALAPDLRKRLDEALRYNANEPLSRSRVLYALKAVFDEKGPKAILARQEQERLRATQQALIAD
ncbi:MAG: hypothetical protein WA979_02475 [Pacificimonas sp.]